jgi:hypothetical protein
MRDEINNEELRKGNKERRNYKEAERRSDMTRK